MGLKLSKGAILMALVVLAACGCQLNNQINDFYSGTILVTQHEPSLSYQLTKVAHWPSAIKLITSPFLIDTIATAPFSMPLPSAKQAQ